MNETSINSEKRSNRKIFKGSVLGYISLILGIFSGILFTPWIIKSVGDGSYGIYTLCTSIVSLFMLDFGLSTTANTFLIKLKARNDTNGIKNLLGLIYKLYFIISAIIAVVFIVCYFLIDKMYKGLTPEEIEKLKFSFIFIGVFSFSTFPCTVFNGILNAYEKFLFVKIADIAHKVIYIATTFLAIIFNQGLYALIFANIFSACITHAIKYIYIRFKTNAQANLKIKLTKNAVKPIIIFSIWAAISSIASRLIFNITPSILGITSDSTNITLFSVSSTIEGYFYLFGSTIGTLFFPKIGRFIEDEDRTLKINDLAIKVGRIQFVIISLIFVGFIVCGQDFINVWLGTEELYDIVFWNIIIISIYQLFFSCQLILWYTMLTINKVSYIAISEIIAAILNILLSFLLSGFLGSTGACLAIFISRAVSLIIQNVFYIRFIKFDIKNFFLVVFLKGIPSILLTIIGGLLFCFFISAIDGWIKLILEILIVIFIFLPTMFLFYINKKEKAFISIFLKNKFRRVK